MTMKVTPKRTGFLVRSAATRQSPSKNKTGVGFASVLAITGSPRRQNILAGPPDCPVRTPPVPTSMIRQPPGDCLELPRRESSGIEALGDNAGGEPWPEVVGCMSAGELGTSRRQVREWRIKAWLASVSSLRCSLRGFSPRSARPSSTIRSPFTASGTATSIGSSLATAPTTRVHTHQNSMHRLPASNTSIGITSTCPGTGTRANGFGLFEYMPLTEALHLIESEPFFQPC